jgi:hypothetical protein
MTTSVSGCSNTVGLELVMDSSNPLANSMYATLLSAKTSGQNVDIQTSGCTSSGIPVIISITLQT